MSSSLPPLRSLQAFEALGRLGTVAKAADELCVTPGAVSQQVQSLSDFLGVSLFVREGRGVRMTDQARVYFELITDGFERFRDAKKVFDRHRGSPTLVVSALPSLANLWLMPKLYAWQQANPHIDIRLEVCPYEDDLTQGNVDFRLTYGRGARLHMHGQDLFIDEAVPVCSPAFRARNGPLETPADIAASQLLHIDWRPDHTGSIGWRDWCTLAQAPYQKENEGAVYSFSVLAVEAAITGQGVLLGQKCFVAGELATKRLVALSEIAVPMPEPYAVAWSDMALHKPSGRAFLDWLVAEATPERRYHSGLDAIQDF